MAGKKQSAKQSNPVASQPGPKISLRAWLTWAAVGLLIPLLFVFSKRSKSAPPAEPVIITGPVTFSKDVAPIIYQECMTCHRPGQSGPFDLVTFADAKKHAKDIARVTAKRIMPPWLPEHGYGEFEGERRLSDRQIAILQKWVEEGAAEGNAAETPAPPLFESEWQLGEPDLVVQAGPFTLPPDGKDVYYNFVTPIPTTTTKYVSGVDFLSGNRVVHHAFIDIDETRTARRRAAKLNPPGFFGMDLPETVTMPGGQLLGWQPGKIASMNAQGLAWTLRTNTDLVLQVHLNPSGKPEVVQPRVGFHFTEVAPTNSAYRLRLTTLRLDIPAGVSNYVAEESYTLPVDLSFTRVGAHAHYLCKEMQGYAILPSGEKQWLLWIKDWDFKWQGDYQYKKPIEIPKGSKIVMHFVYDNSANNIRNPFNPPRRTVWGLQTTDEMGEIYFQTLPRDRGEWQVVGSDYARYFAKVSLDFYKFRVQNNPGDADAHQRLGRALFSFGQIDEAIANLNEAVRLDPQNDQAHFDLGSIYLRQKRVQDAYNEFLATIRINPDDSQALGSLGIICAQAGRLDEAREYFVAALRINPDDSLANQYLQRLNAMRK